MTKSEKISLKIRELWKNPEYRGKMIELRKGKTPWNKGLKTGLVPKSAFKKGYKQSPELIAKRIQSRKGYKHSQETKAKIGVGNKGKQSWSKGLTGIVRAKHKFSPRPNGSGEKHYKWLGGYSMSQHKGTEYNTWRTSVYKRDDFKCKIGNEDCDGKIEAHHILSFTKYPELRYEINNGITLCRKHHPRKMAEEVRLAPVFQDIVLAIAN